MEKKYIYIETYGCSANQNNTEIIKGILIQSGLELTSNPNIADILVINTCIVKEPTEKKIERRISDLSKFKKPIIITGCMPEVRSKKLQNKNIYLLGTHHIKEIAKLIRKIYERKYQEKEFINFQNEEKLLTGKISQDKKIGITQISEGCLGNCSFCLTKLAKGKLFSYPQEKIIENIENDLKAGAKEIWITSQDNASYGLDSGERNLPELLNKIINLKGKFEIRIGMMNPENLLPILDNIIEIYKNQKVKKFLHIPIQSGSDNILKLMNRKYKVKDFLKIVKKFRKQIPDLFLSTDIIVGFPDESESDFNETLKILKQIKPEKLNLSRYWQMKGTSASLMPQLPQEVIKSRSIKIMSEYKNLKKQ